MADKQPITAADLYRFQLVSDPQIAPDGRAILCCVQRVAQKTEKKFTNLWLVPADGRPPRQFTFGDHNDSHPRWSPDGRAIALLSTRQDEKQAQIYLMPSDGGEARPLTELQGEFGSFSWSPDGRRLLLTFRQKDADAVEREADEQKKKLGVVARRITRLDYRMDGKGYAPQQRWHIWTVDADTGETAQLTDGDYDETEPCWSPDGRTILFISNRSPKPDITYDAAELYTIPAGGGDMQQIAAKYGRKSAPSFSPDGQWIAYLSQEQPGKFYQNASLYLLPAAGGEPRNLTAQFDLHLSSSTLNDIGGSPPQTRPTWTPDGRSILSQVTHRGDQPLFAFHLGDDARAQRLTGAGVIGQFSQTADGGQLALFAANQSDPGQVALLDRETGGMQTLTQFNAWLAEVDLGRIEEVTFPGGDGGDRQGWILTPPGFDPGQTYPTIIEIHGGPQTQYGRFFMHEFHYLAAQGYVVAWSNPRGGQGYGEAFAGAIHGRWGAVDYDDVMAWTDFVAALPTVDADRMGVTGGSYGGYMTSLIIGKTDRFQAAVSQRMVSNLISFYGSSDMNILSEHLFGQEAPPWEDVDSYWQHSPMRFIGNAVTPTLVIHSEQDLRCPHEQGEQLFVALRRMGIETEMVLFPDESHGLSRNGRTDRRIVRLEHMLRWFDKYLKG